MTVTNHSSCGGSVRRYTNGRSRCSLVRFGAGLAIAALMMLPMIAAAQVQEALLVYGSSDSVGTPISRIWYGSSWSLPSPALSVGSSELKWVVLEAAPTRPECVLVTINTSRVVTAQVYTDGTWGNLQIIATNPAGSIYRGASVAYESLSGDAVVVAADGDTNPVCRVWNGSTWSAPINLVATLPGYPQWIRLAADPASDKIIALMQDSNKRVTAEVWNGSAWGNERVITLVNASEVFRESAAVEFQQSGGKAIMIWPRTTASQFSWDMWTGSAWQGKTNNISIGDSMACPSLKRDPNSDNMLLSYVDDSLNIGKLFWNSAVTNFGAYFTLNASANSSSDRCVDNEFETIPGHEGHAVVVYSSSTTGRYSHAANPSWNSNWTDAVIANVADSSTVQARRTGDGKILAMFFDDINRQLDFSWWDGTSWSARETIESNPYVPALPVGEPFMMAPMQVEPTGAGKPPAINNTAGATNITSVTALLQGNLTSTGGSPTHVWVYWGTTDGQNVAGNWQYSGYLSILGSGTVSTNVTNLLANTGYFYRYFASNTMGTTWASSSAQFTTRLSGDIPVLNNDGGASNIGTTSATFNGNLTSTGGQPTYVWVYWGTTDGGSSTSAWQNAAYFGLRTVGALTTNITGLASNATYYYRFYATNAIGPAWASPSSQFTMGGVPGINNAGGASGVTASTATLNGNLTSTGSLPTYVWVYWGTTDGGTVPGNWQYSGYLNIRTVGALSTNLTGLSAGSAYYYRFFASNSAGTAWATPSSQFLVGAIPSLDNDGGASNTTATTATMNGNLLSTGGWTTYLWVYWGTTDGGSSTSAWQNSRYLGARSVGFMSTNITGLSSNTTYFYRFYATNAIGTAWAAPSSQFFLGALPGINNDGGASNVTISTATLNGNVVSTGNLPTYVWVYWGTTDGGSNPGSWQNFGYFGMRGIGFLSTNITGLAAGSVYYYRFFVSNSAGTAWAAPSSQFLPGALPAIDNDGGASNITATTATLNGNLTTTGGWPSFAWVYWGTTDGGTTPGSWSSSASLGMRSVGFLGTNVSGLVQGNTYYYRYFVTNAIGTAWASSSAQFFAGTVPVIDNDGGATNITATNATLRGTLTSTGGWPAYVWVYWGTADAGTTNANWQNATYMGIRATGALSTNIDGLASSTLYYYRFFASNVVGAGWASPASQFTTLFGVSAPAVDNNGGASGITSNSATLNGTLTATGGASTYVWVYWGTTDGGAVKGNWAFSSSLGLRNTGTMNTAAGSLLPSTAYYYRFYASNSVAGVWASPSSQFLTSFTGTLPILDNDGGASGITGNSATLNGTLVSTGNLPTFVWVYWGTTDGGTTIGNWQNSCYFGVRTEGAASTNITGLSSGTGYFYRFYATNAIGSAWAAPSSQFISGATPAVDNDGGASGVTASTATLNGTLTSTGNLPTFAWVYWGTTDGGTTTGTWQNASYFGGRTVGALSTNISGLAQGNVYYYRFFVTNAAGTAWASSATLFYPGTAPTLDNDGGASNTAMTTATLNGNLTSTGGWPTYVWVCWGTTDGGATFGSWASSASLGIRSTGFISNNISGLVAGNTYYYRFYATNIVGTAWGAPSKQFYSGTVPAVDNAGGASNLSSTAATLNGSLSSAGGWTTYVWVYWGTADAGTNRATWQNSCYFGARSAGAASTNIAGLTPITAYYYRFFASNFLGQSWASGTSQFTTREANSPPAINNIGAANVCPVSALFRGNLTTTGAAPTQVWLYWGMVDGGTSRGAWDFASYLGIHPIGTVSTSITTLVTNRSYYFRFYATNANGVAWAPATTSFRTASDLGYSPYRTMITTAGYTKQPEVLTNFPVLVRLSEGLGGFSYAKLAYADGSDLRFGASNQADQLNYEIENWNPSGTSHIWVQVPRVTGTNTSFWLFWGDVSKSTPPPCTTDGSTWSGGGFAAVWHHTDGGETQWAYDSTPNNNGGLPFGIIYDAVGMIDGADEFDGSLSYLWVANSATLKLPSTLSVSAWVKADAWGQDRVIIRRENSYRFYCRDTGGGVLAMTLQLRNGAGNRLGEVNHPIGNYNVGQWYHVVGTYDANGGANNLKLYANGAQVAATSVVGAVATPDEDLVIGARPVTPQNDYVFDGIIDEARIESATRSANWIWSCWSNQVQGSAFLAYGKAQEVDCDGDGMPDPWEVRTFGSTTNSLGAATADWDGDHAPNYSEYIAGTDPTNSASCLQISTATMSPSSLVLRWTSASNKTYCIERSDSLVLPRWQMIISNLPSAWPVNNAYTVTPGAASVYYHRVGITNW